LCGIDIPGIDEDLDLARVWSSNANLSQKILNFPRHKNILSSILSGVSYAAPQAYGSGYSMGGGGGTPVYAGSITPGKKLRMLAVPESFRLNAQGSESSLMIQ
jgi:hypothetical protein